LYRSTDGGATWVFRWNIDDFWETLASSIVDPDVVMFGGVELFRSTDGGASFSLVNGWAEYYDDPVHKLHADLPGIDVAWTPQGQEIHWIATDGGLYKSVDRVASVTNVSLQNLGVSQYYTTHTSVNDPTLILAGAQDQGYQRSVGPPAGTLRDFEQLISGDYGHLTSSDGTHQKIYSDYPGFILVQHGELAPQLTDFIDFPAEANHSWLPFILARPGNPDIVYLCADRIWRFRDVVPGGWSITSTAQDFTVAGGSYLTALLISPLDVDRKIAITNSGVIWWTDQPSFDSFVLSPDTGPSSHYFYGTALEPSPDDPLVAYAGGSGYSGPAVWRTTDGGIDWTPVSGGLPPTLVYDLAFEEATSGVLYAATEAGPFRLDPSTDTWSSLDHPGLPLTIYWCVEAVPAAEIMRFGTYGRGIWDYHWGGATSVAALPSRGGARIESRPNPFVSGTTLVFATTRPGPVRLRVYDTAGRLVRDLADGNEGLGEHRREWDGRDSGGRPVAAGVY
ncbi:MAG: FlgD immunoglobulin-like domain containing protein, partial [bacterium]